MLAHLLLCLAPLSPAFPPGVEPSPKDDERAFIEQLRDPKIWTDVSRINELETAMTWVGHYRSKELLSILAPHVHYHPPAYSISDGDSICYVYHALQGYGLDAVDPLLQAIRMKHPLRSKIKKKFYRDLFRAQDEKRMRWAVKCLVAIYSKGGHGVEMTRARIQLEIERETRAEAKQLLRQSLGFVKDAK